MNIPDEVVIASVQTWRDNYAAAHDELGVHFCDLAMARLLRTDGPAMVFEVLEAPLKRLAATGTIHGIDVLATELLLAALSIDAREIVEAVLALLLAAHRPDASVRVVDHLCEAGEECVSAGELEPAMTIARVALDLAVDAGDFEKAAQCLELLAACHEGRREVATAVLCSQQAALYLDAAGFNRRATALRSGLAERVATLGDPAQAEAALEEIATALATSNCAEPAALTYLRLGQLRGADGRHKAALKALRKGAEMAASLGDVSLEAMVYGAMAQAYRASGDEPSAESFAARAELLGAFDEG